MRCPRCHDDYEPGVERCADCGTRLVDDDVSTLPDPSPAAPPADTHLGRFDPDVAARIAELLVRRAVPHVLHPGPDGVEVLVPGPWRDDVRTELTLTWDELLRSLDPGTRERLGDAGGHAPGWFDAPRGGHVDRFGRTVVDPDEAEEAERDAARIVGPTLVTTGAIAVVMGWYPLSSPALIAIGVGLVLVGLFTPR